MADLHLEALLERAAAAVDVSDADRLLDEVLVGLPAAPAPTRRRDLRPLAYAAAVLVIALLAVLAWPSARHAVADFLGIGAVRIHAVDELPPDVTTSLDLGTPVTADEAEGVLGHRPRELGGDVGEPIGRYRRGTAVSTVYPVSDALPGTSVAGVGAILTEVAGGLREELVSKQLPESTDVEPVDVAGHAGYWISGAPHGIVLIEVGRTVREEPLRLAGNVLLWQEGSETLRLETELGEVAAVALAGTVAVPED
jgi:hypothetical protein